MVALLIEPPTMLPDGTVIEIELSATGGIQVVGVDLFPPPFQTENEQEQTNG